jgi:hypothetical protein
MLHAAINDAVVTIDHSGKRYLTRVQAMTNASLSAAADAAAHDTLVALYPTLRASIEQHYASLLGQVSAGRRKLNGVRVGSLVAAQLLSRRANDGSGAWPPRSSPARAPVTTNSRRPRSHRPCSRTGRA